MQVRRTKQTTHTALATMTRRRMFGRGAVPLGVAAALAACAPGAAQQGPAGGTRTKQPVTLRWSTWGNDKNPMVEAAAKGAALFKEKLPHVTVEPEPQVSTPGGQSWRDKILAKWLSGTGPDVSGNCCASLPDWGRQGLLADMTPLLKRDGKQVPLSDYVEALLKTWNTPERGQFALPMYMGTFGLYYNRTMFRRKGIPQPGANWDWNRWREAMVRLAEPDQKQWGWYVAMNFPRPGISIRQNGGWQVDLKDNTKAAWDSPEALNALQWMHDRMWQDRTMAKAADISSLGVSAYIALSQGSLATLTEGSWILARWVKEAPEQADQWDVAVLPKGPARRDTGATIDGWAIWQGSKHSEGAWELVKFLQGDQWQELAVTIVGHQPARKSWQDRYVELTKKGIPQLADKNIAAFADGTKKDYARPEQFFKEDNESKKVWSATVSAVFTKNEKSVVDAFRAAAQQVNAINAAAR
ncbi:MAG: sugar ABC transporter substrate-binding protein [Chloroflexi bacterium]|nr:sugar ABC transporter substrate-binding protein [Chloroflexota bacterium]